MGNFFHNYFNLFKALWTALVAERSLHLLAMSASLIFVSTVFYVIVEGWSVIDAIYFSVATMSTVGYGDIAPTTIAGKVFTVLFIITGIGIFVSMVTTVASNFVANFKVRK